MNNSVALLSRIWLSFQLVSWSKFSAGCCNSLSLCPFKREDFVHDYHTTIGPGGTVMKPSGLLVLFMGRAVTHALLALFSRQANTSLVLHALWAYVCYSQFGESNREYNKADLRWHLLLIINSDVIIGVSF